ncbi:MAG: F0F1 ATP synthase subunit B [Firmicutes bacterium]|nr:F0F1 ATP synthase subunit B [Bacillota bacterium]
MPQTTGPLAQLGIQWGTMISVLVAFLILAGGLAYLLWRPLTNMLRQREEHISAQLNHADEEARLADERLKEIEAQLAQARNEAASIIENARKIAEAQSEEIQERARQEAERLRRQAEEEIDRQREMALSALRAQVAALTMEVTRRLLEKEIDPDVESRLVEEALREIEAGPAAGIGR